MKSVGGDYVREILELGKLRGQDRSCPYYPCHKDGHDCTWCFCPFYPCLERLTGGRWVKNSQTGETVWSCKDCEWIHEPKTAELVLVELLQVKNKIEVISHDRMLLILQRILKEEERR